jgi:hypothetical protein
VLCCILVLSRVEDEVIWSICHIILWARQCRGLLNRLGPRFGLSGAHVRAEISFYAPGRGMRNRNRKAPKRATDGVKYLGICPQRYML